MRLPLEKALGPEYTILRINTCSMYMYVTSILGPTSDISNTLLHKRYIYGFPGYKQHKYVNL